MARRWYASALSTTPPSVQVGALESAVDGGAEWVGNVGVALDTVTAEIRNADTGEEDATAEVTTDVVGSYYTIAFEGLTPGHVYQVPMVITPQVGNHWERVLVVECPAGS